MALAIQSRHHGTVRFYREPKRNGGDLVAVFPKSDDDTPGKRECFINHPADAGYHDIDAAYLRTLRTADASDPETREVAEFIVWRIDDATDYASSLTA